MVWVPVLKAEAWSRLRGPKYLAVGTGGVQALLGFIASVVTARLLIPDQRGYLAFVASISAITVAFGEFGVPHLVHARISAGWEPSPVARFGWRTVKRFGLVATVPAVTLLVTRQQSIGVTIASGVVGISTIGIVAANLGRRTLIASGEYRWANLERVIVPLLRIGLALLFLAYWGQGTDSALIAYLLVLSAIPIATGLPYLANLRWLVATSNARLGREARDSMMRSARQIGAGSTMQVLLRFGDRAIVPLGILPPAEVGYYAAASALTEPLQSVLGGLSEVLITETNESDSLGTGRLIALYSLLLVVPSVVIGLAGQRLMGLVLGAAYEPAGTVFLVLMLGVPSTFVRVLGQAIVLRSAQDSSFMRINGLALAANMTCIAAFKEFGAVGVATASVVAYSLAAALTLRVILRP